MYIKENFYSKLHQIREDYDMNEETINELTGKGKLDSIRLYHKNKADEHGTNAFRIATNRSSSKTQKYSNEFAKRMVHKAKEDRATSLITQRNKKKTVKEDVLNEGALDKFVPPFKANGLHVEDKRGNSVLEVMQHGSLAKEVAACLNKHYNK